MRRKTKHNKLRARPVIGVREEQSDRFETDLQSRSASHGVDNARMNAPALNERVIRFEIFLACFASMRDVFSARGINRVYN